MELPEVIQLLSARDARVTWHDKFYNRKQVRGEFFQIRSGPHWLMVSVADVPFPNRRWSALSQARTPEELLELIEEAQAALDNQKL